MIRTDSGQSLVEVALALPFLLLIVLGIGDLARFSYYSTAVTNAAREGALFGSRNISAGTAEIAQHACDELGFAPFGAPCPATVHIECKRSGSECDSRKGLPGDVQVHVFYDFSFVSMDLANAVLGSRPVVIHGWGTFPGVAK